MPFTRAPNCATGPSVKHSILACWPWRLRAVRERKPLTQMLRGFVRRLPIEGHQRRRHSGLLADLSPPPVLHERDLNLVGPPANGLFEAMNNHVGLPDVGGAEGAQSYASATGDQAKAGAKGACTGHIAAKTLERRADFFSLSGCPQFLHGGSTVFPQADLFHRLTSPVTGLVVQCSPTA